MKLNRAQFKKIIKECIKELITEGAFDNVIKENVQPAVPRVAANDFVGQVTQPSAQATQGAPATSFSQVGHMTPNQRLRELSRMAAMHSSKGDQQQAAVMESIFADTAMTTLQKQMGMEMTGGSGGGLYTGEQGGHEADQIDQAEISALSGDRPPNHWAALAFGKYEKE